MPATTEDHSLQTTVHRAHRWEYDEATEREAAGGFVATDVGKLALQLDNYSFWVLTAVTPIWEPVGLVPNRRTIGADGPALQSDDIVFLDTAGGSVTLDLLAAADRKRPLTIKNIGVAGNSGFANPDGAETIDGESTNYELVDGDKITIIPSAAGAWETL